MTKREYEGDKDPRIGFLFNCTKKHVRIDKPISAEEIAELPAWCNNGDDLFIRCKVCDHLMIFSDGPLPGLDGRWACMQCDRTVHETTPYKELDRINRMFESESI